MSDVQVAQQCDSPRSFYDRETGRLECNGCHGDCPQAWGPFDKDDEDDE